MKKPFEPYELSRTEIEILRALALSAASISELAERIGKSPPLAKEAVENLRSKGFTDLERQGKRRVARLSQTKHAQTLRDLFLAYPHISWQDLLSFSGILPILKLDGATPAAVSRTTEWRALRNMMGHGIITRDEEGGFRINPRFQRLREFIREFQNYNNSRLASQASPAAIVVWNQGPEFIIRVPRGTRISDKRFQPTATTILSKYGMPLVSNREYYFFSPLPRRLSLEDVVLQTLLVDGVANTTYALILVAKARVNKRRLFSKAENYHLRDRVEGMLRFLETRTPQPGLILPGWEDLVEKAADYGVKL
jgi:DNA-binding transcriptional ArsR family regulator